MPGHLKLSPTQMDLVADYVESLGQVGVVTDTKTVWEARAFAARVGLPGDWAELSIAEQCGLPLRIRHFVTWLIVTQRVKPSTAKTALKAAEEAVNRLERTIGTTATAKSDDIAATNADLARLSAELRAARADLDAARAALAPIPAKVPATNLDPDTKRATLPTNRRTLQMVCRLLAYNAELDLSRALNAYLADPDEYRAITRNLLHQPGTIAFTPTTITVTIRRPDAPRIARALQNLIDQLNTKPPRLTGDGRPITYHITPKP